MDFLERFRNKLVHFLVPLVERFYLFIAFVLMILILIVWSYPQPYWQTRAGLIWLIVVTVEISQAGITENNYLPIQPGSGPFYHIYRFIDRVFFLFFLIWLLFLLIPEPPLWITRAFSGVFIVALILRAVGDWKYRPKRPEE
ncbi:hypothetical protein [Caproiciproducens sp. CPB-2]|uniref:hypothetical protein n=1 Tax=unclassified Caproiciproducens TaxID=2643836 RepID=UPI0023DBC654|nr:hypothetical protein [Caproiciproducens sp. CPB-2]MDF1494433.1 hypothetical protein [Caproiciproducens sp. CPB-2]